MRDDIHESGQAGLGFTRSRARPSALHPPLVAAARDDSGSDRAAGSAEGAGRRGLAARQQWRDAMQFTIDHAHAVLASPPAGDGGLLRQLSRQLSMLESQHRQLRALLEQTERRVDQASRVGR
ncbi:MAG TPA: hypothetical protein VEQ85_11515 [Lacipirellulaceae bacterium]|nr:hypothetical protein [Lacipirellulaceae bacterium]